jgi:hypothetical protein
MPRTKIEWPKKIDQQDEEIVFELYDIHGMKPSVIAKKFEIDPDYLFDWLRQRIYKSKRGPL